MVELFRDGGRLSVTTSRGCGWGGGGLIYHLFSSRDASFASTVMLYALFSINLNVSMLGDHFHFISLTDAVE